MTYGNSSIRGRMWIDTDGDGSRDIGETGQGGVAVQLISAGADNVFGSADDVVVRSTSTAADGTYSFTGLAAGTYAVRFGSISNYIFTSYHTGGNAALNSDAGAGGYSQSLTLLDGQARKNIDAGLVYCPPAPTPTASIGDRVWIDANNNGLQDSGEAGAAGVSVALKGAGADGTFGTADDTVLRSTTTGSDGSYAFTGLTEGQYQLQFGTLAGFQYTGYHSGANTAADSDAGAGGLSQVVTLADGENNSSIDAGLFCPPTPTPTGSIGDRVWIDANNNGVQDGGEAGAAGVSVQLKGAGTDGVFGTGDDTVLRTTTTASNGSYAFTGLTAGQYQLQFGTLAGYEFSAFHTGANTAVDSDAGAGGLSQVVTLASEENNSTLDAGLYLPPEPATASLGDRVWIDANNNGVQDGGEAGAAGVSVQLKGAGTDGVFGTGDDTVLRTTTTASNGSYSFTGLTAGQYQLQFGTLAGYEFSAFQTGANTAVDSDAGAGGLSQVVTLANGENNSTIDAGLYLPPAPATASLGDRVWIDANNNGVQDSGEAGASGVLVTLKTAGADGVFGTGDDVSTGVTVTQADGTYRFTGLAAGQYQVQFGTLAGFQYTGFQSGANTAVDSDAGTNGLSQVITLANGENNSTIDAGLYLPPAPTASLGDRVWIDANNNGVQDGGEAGASGVSVLLKGAGTDGVFGTGDDTVLRTTTTTSNGSYSFTGLTAGQYQVQFGTLAGYQFSAFQTGANTTVDSDAGAGGLSQVVTLTNGENNSTIDAGLYLPPAPTASLGDRVWIDANNNGVQDGGEAGASGVSVLLKGAGTDGVFGTGDDTVLRTTTTASDGSYSFTGLTAGPYQVQFGTLAGYQYTGFHTGANTAVDSDAGAGGLSQVVTLTNGENNSTIDAGLYLPPAPTASLGDRVWEDKNFNGIQDAGESGIAGVTVRLLNSSNAVVGTKVTDANGNYLFNELPVGSYKVQVLAPQGYFYTKQDQGSDTTDSDVNASGLTVLTTLTAGENDLSWDAGLYRKASIGDRLWLDINHNGVQDAGENATAAGVRVHLLNAYGQIIQTTQIDTSGRYLFSNLDPGTYSLQFDKVNVTFYWNSGWENGNLWWWGYQNVGDDRYDSDVNNQLTQAGVVSTQQTFLESGENDMTWDAALTPIAIDLNGDGIHTTALGATTGTFDLLDNGTQVRSGWLSSGDAFLAVDSSGNGRIDSRGELFGGANYGDGFAKLASYDSNGDGLVDINDADFGKLLLWRDANSNHQTDAGELMTLAQAGIASLTVAYTDRWIEQNGNFLGESSSATRTDGSSLSMIDVYFAYAPADQAATAGTPAPALSQLLTPSNELLDSAFGGGHRTTPIRSDVHLDDGEVLRRVAHSFQMHHEQLLAA